MGYVEKSARWGIEASIILELARMNSEGNSDSLGNHWCCTLNITPVFPGVDVADDARNAAPFVVYTDTADTVPYFGSSRGASYGNLRNYT